MNEKIIEHCLFYKKNNIVLNENCVEVKLCINRDIKSSDITIQLYRCYDEYEAPIICNTTVYLSWLVHLEDFLEKKYTLGEFTYVNMKNYGYPNVRKHIDSNVN